MQNEASELRVGAVVLAAGLSIRMGRPKALLPWGEGPMIGHVLGTLADAGVIGPVVVVTGHQAEEVAAVVAVYGARCVHNCNYAAGEMLSSVQCGIAAVGGEVDGLMIVLGDQPMVRPATLQRLVTAWRRSGRLLAIPTYEGRRGHPLIFAGPLVPEILALREPETLRDLVHRHLAEAIEEAVDDGGVIGDVDTPEDYQRALAQWQKA